MYYNKLVRAKETAPQQITPTPASPHSCSSSPTSTSPTTLIFTTATTSVVPTIDTLDDSLEEGLACIFQDILVDIALLLAMTASKDNPNPLEYHHWHMNRLGERWEHVKHLVKPSQELAFDLIMCSVGVRLHLNGIRVKDYTSARAAAFKFFDLMDHPMLMYLPISPSIVAPILEYFVELQDAESLAYFLSRLQLHNAAYLNAPSLTTILERINRLLVRVLGSSLPVHA